MTAGPQKSSSGFVRRMVTGFALMSVGAALALVSAGPASANDHRHAICHATGSSSNPYVFIKPAKAGDVSGHYGGDHQNGEDIIPPFEYEGQNYEQNWDAEGQAIFANRCRPVTSTSTTSSSTTTKTTTQSTTTSQSRSDHQQTTTQATTTSDAKVAAAGTPTAPRTTRPPGPIPGAVDAGVNEASSWQLPVGGALILLGGVGMTTALVRRNAARR